MLSTITNNPMDSNLTQYQDSQLTGSELPTTTTNSNSSSGNNSSRRKHHRTSSFNPTTVVIAGQNQTCTKCSTPVYPAEQILVDNFTLHPGCFRCHHCNQLLSLSNSEKVEGRFFCKAHYKLYSSGDDIKLNPYMANARYSLVLPLAAESEATGKSAQGRKAAYESLVGASRNRSSTMDGNPGKVSFSELRPSESSPRRLHNRTRSLIVPRTTHRDDKLDLRTTSHEFPISKIVQDRLRLYEPTEDPPFSKLVAKKGVSFDDSSPFLSESLPTSRTDPISILSSTPSQLDSSFIAASKTKLRSRIQTYQGKWSSNFGTDKGELVDDIQEDTKTGTLTRTFKNVVESLIKHGRQNDTDIQIRENLARRRSVRVSPTQLPTSPTTHHSSEVNVEGELASKYSVSDPLLVDLVEQIHLLSPPPTAQVTIDRQITALDRKLSDQHDTVIQLQAKLRHVESLLANHSHNNSG